ncbi:M16 family metallopeptidase [Sphingomonas xanthus]|uniref:Insulinase family protein n=1 Tax=Sphingomonas xanthus TaxID=2594473 RepID=A0A516IPF4_9SPHN|nr:insulinase family protein [Sphingomonas xanthus]QDP18805.1 insulinase family protein [Sphingomonas xanthus]
MLAPMPGAAVPAGPAGAANGWGIPLADITPDPAIRLGTLPNGMRYAIMRNETPKGTASVRLRFQFGSIHEGEQEQGLAHFIEHMAFNGTTNVPEGEMVKRLERLGLAFGPDNNAMTGFDSTTYLLELPASDEERVDTALFLMREVASEIRFDRQAVDRERGVILSERRSRDGFNLRQTMDRLNHLVPGSLYAKRLPIGTYDVLTKAPAERMQDLYRRYYRPERATLIFVGDIDPDAIEAKIRDKFAGWQGIGPAGAEPQKGSVDFARPAAVDNFFNLNIATSANWTVLKPYSNPLDSQAERRRNLLESLGTSMFARRLTRLVNRDGSDLIGSSISAGDFDGVSLTQSITISAKDGAWPAALTAIENELRRAQVHGFTAAELRRELAAMDTSFKTAAEQANTRRNAALAGAILSALDDKDINTHPSWRLQFYERNRASLTLDAVNAAFRELWKGSAPLVHVSDKKPVNGAEIGAALAMARNVAVSAPREESDKAFAYESFGTPGKITEDKRIADLDIRTVQFANNVRLNIKKTEFEAGRVRFSVRMAGGQLALPRDKPGLGIMMSSLSAIGGTGKHSLEEMKEVLAGRVYSAGSAVGSDSFVSAGSTSPADLPLQMKVSAAFLTDPGFRPEAARRWTNMVPVMDKQFDSEPESVYATRAQSVLMGGDLRFGAPPAAELMKRNLAEAQAVLKQLAATAPIEIGIVGDIDEEAAIRAVAESFGALPARAATTPDYREARQAALRPELAPIELVHNGALDKALVAALWPTDDDDNYRREIGMIMLAKALDLILTDAIREQLGASYGVNVGSNMSDVYEGFGTLGVSTIVAPGKIADVEQAIDAAVAEIRAEPISEDLFNRVRAPMLEALAKSRRENSYWLAVVDEAQSKANRLDRYRQQEALFKAITPAELHQLALAYLDPAKQRRIRIRKPAVVKIPAPTRN